MKKKIRLITGGIISLLVLALSSYYFGFWEAQQVKLDMYSQEKNEQVDKYLTEIYKAKSCKEKKNYYDKLTGLSFQGKQNILHYAFNHGDPDLLRLLVDRPISLTLFESKDHRGNTPMYYYRQYCKFSNLKPLEQKTLAENPLNAINHIVDYFDKKDVFNIREDGKKSEKALTLAIEKGKLEDVKNFLFSIYGNNDKSQWKEPLTALADLRSTVANKEEIESLLSTLKADRKEDDKFWQQARKNLSSASSVDSMVNYLHKLVATSPKEKCLLYYIVQIGGLRGYQMYKHIEKNHSKRMKTTFSDLLLAANDPHNPIKLTLDHKDEYQQRLEVEVAKLKGYIHIDANKFAQVNPKDRREVQQVQFDNMRTFFHACVLKEAPKKLELCCTKYFDCDQILKYEDYCKQKDYFGLTPDDYLPLVKDPEKKQHLKFLQDHVLAPTQAEIDFLHTYKTKAEELELGNLNFDGSLQAITKFFVIKQKDNSRNICHIAALLGDIETIKFLSTHYAYFKTLCEEKDAFKRTAHDYAELWLDKSKKKDMCGYLTTKFDIQGELTKAAVEKAIQQSNWHQIGRWQREETIAFGAIWTQHGSDLLQIAMLQQKPTTDLGQHNYLKLLELLSKCDLPTQKMVQNNKVLVDEIDVPISSEGDAMRKQFEQKAKAKAKEDTQITDNNSIKEITNKLGAYEKCFILDHTNKTILHRILPKVVANATAAEFKTLLNIGQESFKIALWMVDDNQMTPLGLIKKALKDKKNNAKEVDKKLDIIKKYEEGTLATYQSKYKCNTKETAASLYKKDNIFGLVAYLSYPASYMRSKLLETMIKDGAYDVVKKVYDTNNPYVISAAKALIATKKDNASSVLETLLADKTVVQALKCRYLLKEGEFITQVVNDKSSMAELEQIKRMWKAYPVYCAIMANRYWNEKAGKNNASDETPVLDKLYEMYRFVIPNAQKKLYGFNNAHVAVIDNQLALLEKYAKDKPVQLEHWLNETDHMGRTPLYYINYGQSKTKAQKKALFKFINKYVHLNAVQILKSPSAAGMLSYIKERPFRPESHNVRRFIFLSPKQMLEELAQKEKAGRNPLHYACLGIDNDITWLRELLKAGGYTEAQIAQEDINGCSPIDYVPEDRKAEFQAVFAIYSPMGMLAEYSIISDMQYLAQEALDIYAKNNQNLSEIKECAQSIAGMLNNGVLIDSKSLSSLIDKLHELKKALKQIDTNNLGEEVKKVIIKAYDDCKALKLGKDNNAKQAGKLLTVADQLKDIHLFTCKVETLQSLKIKIDNFISVVNANNWNMPPTIQEENKVIDSTLKSAKGATIIQGEDNAPKKTLEALDNITKITILDLDSKMSEKLSTLVKSVKDYKLNTQQKLSYQLYGKAKKFWRKSWCYKIREADSWSSLFALDTIEQDSYFPELYSQLLKPAYAHIAKALITEHSKLKINLNEQDHEGKTWLLKAIEKQQWSIARCLIEAGADLSIKDIYDTNVQFLTIVHKKDDRDLKTQLLDYIKVQQEIARKKIVGRTFDKASAWVSKRFKQIFYLDKPLKPKVGGNTSQQETVISDSEKVGGNTLEDDNE